MKILKTEKKSFYKDLDEILKSRSQISISKVDNSVRKIIKEIIDKGDKALFKFAKKFDGSTINSKNILLSKKILNSYKNKVDFQIIRSFKIAIKNITEFHKKQKPYNYTITKKGVKTKLIWKPIESVGLYIPGGNAIYPSSLIMNVIPAIVAGVKRIVIVTPSKFNKINPYILAIIKELSIKEVYQVGGPQAIAALTYGTKSIKSVNKIFGPGNAYIASAKKQVFGKVGIDLIAGPSEIIVVANKKNNPKWVATDLIAQAEHDEQAQSILITDNEDFAKKVVQYIGYFLLNLPKKDIVKKSLGKFGIIIIDKNLNDSYKVINHIAPEHLHLHVKPNKKILNRIKNAGGIFLGEYSSEAFGDYIVGTNHVLPTSHSAKFSSGLGVLDFMKRTSIVEINKIGYQLNQENVSKMATVEGLEGHKLSVKIRQTVKK